jgi:hypothetical protein
MLNPVAGGIESFRNVRFHIAGFVPLRPRGRDLQQAKNKMHLIPVKAATLLTAPLILLAGCSRAPTEREVARPYPGLGDVPLGERLGVVWEELPGNPRINQSDCPEWYCLGQTDPWVARGKDGSLVAWFSTGGDRGGPVVGLALVDEQMRFTVSPADRPVLELKDGVWDKHRETVSVRWDPDDETWTMWYLGYETSFFDDPGFGQMRSLDRDGELWERSGSPIYRPAPGGWDHAFITGPRCTLDLPIRRMASNGVP